MDIKMPELNRNALQRKLKLAIHKSYNWMISIFQDA